jgi:aryl-alcohol dehydrogenase-like predicted oxidoreductase
MIYRTFGRMGWSVSEIDYGMWGLAGWTGSDETESQTTLEQAVALGCNFFDTAWAYGSGRSEQILGGLLKNHPGKTLHFATKIPPKNLQWPSRRGSTLDDCFPPDHIREGSSGAPGGWCWVVRRKLLFSNVLWRKACHSVYRTQVPEIK